VSRLPGGLRFLADESCDFGVVLALRKCGYDVRSVAESTTQSEDGQVIRQARKQNRVLLTEDRDFGWLVFVSHAACSGVILIRFPSRARSVLPRVILEVVQKHSAKLFNSFVVVQPGQIRISQKL